MADKVAERTNGELSETAQRYDRLRKSIPLIQKPNVLVLTHGILGTFPKEVAVILWMVRKFDTFNEGNDPWHEHDFGALDYKGKSIFWKIDDHGGYEGYELVLTVMLASEY
ncbi:MAG: hypothetical protein A4E61_01590 [Syntrophorhabdus sp. PtaB.Bin184]|nr:MAG: hypothetical protein A4E61_01590 [Syntrophorhabdus sp. PtaB.Bin184]